MFLFITNAIKIQVEIGDKRIKKNISIKTNLDFYSNAKLTVVDESNSK